MTTSLILLLYLADVVSGIRTAAVLGSIGLLIAIVIASMVAFETGEPLPWRKKGLLALIVMATFSAILPSKSTIYASAAVYVAGEAASTEEFNLVRQMVTQELRQLVEKGKK